MNISATTIRQGLTWIHIYILIGIVRLRIENRVPTKFGKNRKVGNCSSLDGISSI